MSLRRIGPSFLYPLFFFSGAAGLGYQLIWTKMFTAGLGHEMPALIAVVSAFLGGIACGGWWLDRAISASANPKRWYGALELVIGAWGALAVLFIPLANDLALTWIGASASMWRQGLIAFALAWVTLLPATVAMGATLPAMERWLAPLTTDGRCLGVVYGWNTLGAVAGTLVSAFVLMPALGFRGSALVFAGINLLCGAIALALPSFEGAARKVSARPPPHPISDTRLMIIVFSTGLLGIAFEIVGVRVLAQVLEGTVYTFAAVLSVYLLGTALGAGLYQKLLRAKMFDPLLTGLLAGLAAVCAVGAWFLSRAPWLYRMCRAWFGDTLGAVLVSEMIVAAAVFGMATILMGATFSHLVQAARRGDGGVGRASALNMLGGALAGGLFGAVLLPIFGAKGTLMLIAGGYLLFAMHQWKLLLLWPRKSLVHFCLAGVLGVSAFAWSSNLRLVEIAPGEKVIFFREGVMASVAVVENSDGNRTLRVNSRFQMGGSVTAIAERRQAIIPLLLHAQPRRALFLGPGTGITLGGAAAYPGLQIDAVELVPEVIEAMRFFEPWNLSSMHQPNVHLHAADARRFVRVTETRYDVIVADLFHPAQDGAGFLYTREHFQAVRNRLNSGGLFCQWLPLHQLDEASLRGILRTFTDTFSESHAFLLHFNVDIPVLGLVGTLEPLQLPGDWLERRASDAGWREKMKGAGLDRTINLFGCLVAGPEMLRRYAGDAPLATDNFPNVSFTAPRFTVRRDAKSYDLLLGFLDRCADEPRALMASAGTTQAFAKQLSDFIAARDGYLRGLAREGGGPLAPSIDLYLESARRSLYFTPAYARCVGIIQALARTDMDAARRLFDRLEEAQPAQPLGRKMLGPLLEKSP